MRNSIYIFPFVAMLLVVSVVSCSGKKDEVQKEKVTKEKSPETSASIENDTVWKEDVRYKIYEPVKLRFDTSFVSGEKRYTLLFESSPLNEKYEGIHIIKGPDKVIAQRNIGENRIYKLKLLDENDELLKEKSFDKFDLEKYVAIDLLAGSDGTRWFFKGFNSAFGQIYFDSWWIFQDSDVGEDYMVFLDLNLNFKHFFFDSFTGGGDCDCNYEPSNDQRTYVFCNRILRSDGSSTIIDNKEQELVGTRILNNEYILAVYVHEGKPPYNNAKILRRNGSVAKSFDFEGYEQDYSYALFDLEVSDSTALYLYDLQQECLFRLDRENPEEVKRIKFETMKAPNEEQRTKGKLFNVSTDEKSFTLTFFDSKFYLDSED